MTARVFSSGDRSGQNPHWYWRKGLHDAEITHVDIKENPMDFRQRTSLILHLDSSQAMFDTNVTAIELRNFKILLDESSFGGYSDSGICGCYWMQDVLTWDKGKYILNIALLGEDDFHFVIRFEDAQVHRK